MLTTEKIAAALVPGTHASTFGGNPVASAAAVRVLDIILEESFLPGVREKGLYFSDKLQGLADKYPLLATGVRGLGLILGMVLTEKGIEHGTDVVNTMFEKGYLMNFAGGAVLRFVPPLVVTEQEIDRFVAALDETLAGYMV
jgi:acetylornithine aminotransferase/acetylornithine/N-succinyldiaminopimelate aminotransferase